MEIAWWVRLLINHMVSSIKTDSREHQEAMKKLRTDSVEHIRQNLSEFEQHIVWREDFDQYAVGDDM